MNTPEPYSQWHFIGREPETKVLRAKIDGLFAGLGGVILLVGEPGIGKTRLATESASYASRRGCEVLWGRCWEGDGAPAYLPWIQIVRESVACQETATVSELEHGEFEEISRIMPELKLLPTPIRDSHGLSSSETDEVRFRAFDAIGRYFRKIAGQQPVVLIIDDLQWADHPSLVLLEFLVREILHDRLLVLVTCRSADPHPMGHVQRTLGGLVRHEWVQLLALQGLDQQSVVGFVTRELGCTDAKHLASIVYKKTDGNPFFVGELVRLLRNTKITDDASGAALLGIPTTVREVIRRRLDFLAGTCRQIVNIASVIGAEFDLSVVKEVAGYTTSDLLESLDQARQAGVVAEVDGRVRLYRFSHDLIRDAIYADLPRTERVNYHHQIGAILERLHSGDIKASLAQIAYHFFRAAPAGDLRKAVDYSTKAAEHAAESLAYEDAIGHYQRSLEALGRRKADQLERCRILLGLGDALNRVGATPKARKVFSQAADLAKDMGSAELLARAALGHGWEATTGFVDKTLVSLLEESIVRFANRDSALHAHVLSRLARALYWSEARVRSLALSEQAVSMAIRVQDRGAEAIALIAKVIALWGADHIQERRLVTEEIERLAEQLNDKEIGLIAKRLRILDLLEGGEVWELDREIERHGQLALEVRQPLVDAENRLFRSMRALMDGRFGEVEEQERHVMSIAADGHSILASLSGVAQMFFLRRCQGRLRELGGLLDRMVQDYPGLVVWRCGVAIRHCELGMVPEARRQFDRLASRRFSMLPRDGNWLVGLALLAELCAHLEDSAGARDLYALLAPYEDRHIVVGYGAVCLGSAARYLGMLSMALGQFDRAVAHFEKALQANLGMSASLLVARTRHQYAKVLLARSGPGDLCNSRDQLCKAIVAYRSMGAKGFLRDAQELWARAGGDNLVNGNEGELRLKCEDPIAPSVDGGGFSEDFLRREMGFWSVCYQGKISRLRHRKGLEQLAVLLREPNREFHVLELVGTVEGQQLDASHTARQVSELGLSIRRLGDAGVVSDAKAVGQYRDRLRDLVCELEEARQKNDLGRVALLRGEVEYLSTELRASRGYRGRARVAGSMSERARVSIRNNISAVMRDIQNVDEDLWRHLSKAVKTGTFCCYRSEKPIKCE
jgi:tetratricopeptide (TPR) repeat protein